MKSGGFHHEIRRISGEIHPEPYKFRCFSKNSSVWVDFTWDLLDFMVKSARFHGEIWQISCEIHPEPYKFRCFSKKSSVWVDFTWNPPDFTWNLLDFMKSTRFHADFMKSSGFHVKSKDLLQGSVTLCFILVCLSIERPILDHHPKAHIHEIQQISWNPWNPWNPADFRWNPPRTL